MRTNKLPIEVILVYKPHNAIVMYQELKEKFGYPEIEPYEEKEILRGRFYVTAFALMMEDYRKIVPKFEDWEDFGYRLGEIGLRGMSEDTQQFLTEIDVEFESIREDYWSIEDGWPEFDYCDVIDVFNEALIKIQKIICKDILTIYDSKKEIMNYFFNSFRGFYVLKEENYVLNFNDDKDEHDFLLCNFNKKQKARRETLFWNEYFKELE